MRFRARRSDSDTLPTLLQATLTSAPGRRLSIGEYRTAWSRTGRPTRLSTAARRLAGRRQREFTLTEPDGTTYQFRLHPDSYPLAAFYQSTTPGGDTVTATYSVGRIANVVYKTDGAANAYQRLDYTYDPVSGNIATETLSTGTGTPLRQQAYFDDDGITSPLLAWG